MDDLTLAEAINLPSQLVTKPDKTGLILPKSHSLVCEQLVKTSDYANKNEMKINQKKTKAMIFNPCSSLDFTPEITLGTHQLEVVDQTKLLGVTVTSDLKWSTNTQNLVKKGNKRLWLIRRLKRMGASDYDLVDMYCKQMSL